MLETASERLSARGGPHFGSPDKLPARRLATIAAAGEAGVPLTTGILIGIGETRAERVEALCAIRDLGERYGHIQEVIVQNFRAKAGTKMARRTGAGARGASVDGGNRADPARRGVEHPGAAESELRGLSAAARRRHQRLGRDLAGDGRPREPGGAVAGGRPAPCCHRRAWPAPGAAARRVPRVPGGAGPVARSLGGATCPAAIRRGGPCARGRLGGRGGRSNPAPY